MSTSQKSPYLLPGVAAQTKRIFAIYNVFRLVLSLILLLSFVFSIDDSALGAYNPDLFFWVTSLYAVANTITLFGGLIWKDRPYSEWFLVAVIVFDILVLTLISNTCGGVDSGMTHLLIVPIAAGSVLIPGIFAIFLAAIGSIALIYSEIYLYLTFASNITHNVQAGILGVVLFGTAVVIQFLSKRIRANEQVAEEQAQRIAALTQMNQKIIQQMNTGIIVVDQNLSVQNANDAAKQLLNQPDAVSNELILPDILTNQLGNWKRDVLSISSPFRLNKSEIQILAGFSYLNLDDESLILISLEDYSRLLSRAQQLKLVSLGRLTASIAHEIRNPLGAISHASQLLKESDHLTTADSRLTEIIQTHSLRVDSIISNILELSRTRNIVPEIMNLKSWLEEFVSTMTHSSSEPITINMESVSDDITIRFSPAQLEQVLTNLCENGLRHSRLATNKATLTLKSGTDPITHNPYLDIIDDGIGINEEDNEKIFEPFFTTESTGTGLGLYISRELCEAQQASLSYRRDKNSKSCFRISFSHLDTIT